MAEESKGGSYSGTASAFAGCEGAAAPSPHQQQPSTPARKHFSAADDLILLRAANTIKPWEAPYGTANGVMKSFEKIAELCAEAPGFVEDKPRSSLRTRFDKLLKQHRESERASRRASGITEEYEERDVLLQDITQRMDGWKSSREDARQAERAKSDGIEASGLLLRRLAMGELEEELSQDGQAPDDDPESTEASTTDGKSAPKRAGSARKGRSTKVAKSEKLHAVTDAIAHAVEGISSGNPDKYAYLSKRLEFEKEEAEKKREHEEKLERRREEAERAREERMLAAERAREQFMVQLLEVALGRKARHDNPDNKTLMVLQLHSCI